MDTGLKVSFYGDFTFGENYQAKYDFQNKISLLRKKGYDYLFEDVKQFLHESDYNIVNLETQITNTATSDLEGKKAVLHWNDPDIAPDLLNKYNIHAVSLGNNHGYDFKHSGLIQSINSLKKADISYFGAGLSEDEAKMPHKKEFTIEGKPFNLYVFGGYKYREDYDKEYGFYAKEEKSGVNLLIPERCNLLIKKIKESDPDSYIVMFSHFGFDLQKTVPMQKEMAKAWVDSGADAVIGHGPHMINQMEYYKGKPLIYSLGNFIFPADFRGKCSPYNLIARLNAKKENDKISVSYELYPIYMDSNSKTPKTRKITEDEIETVLDLLCEDNQEIRNSITVDKNNQAGICFKPDIK